MKVILALGKRFNVKEKASTYCRKARKAYLGFQKKRGKTRREINLMRGKLLRYLKRNIGQFELLAAGYDWRLKAHERNFLKTRLETVKRIYAQQYELWRTKSRSVKQTRAWYLRQHKKRASRMEGIIGLVKNRFGLDRVKYRMAGGEEMWVRLGLLAMNLSTAMRKMEAKAAA